MKIEETRLAPLTSEVIGVEDAKVQFINEDGDTFATAEIRFDHGRKYKGTFMYSDADDTTQWYVSPDWCELGLVRESAYLKSVTNPNCAGYFSMSPFEDWEYLVGFFDDRVASAIEEELDKLL